MKYLLALSAALALSVPAFANSHAEKAPMESKTEAKSDSETEAKSENKAEAKSEIITQLSPHSVSNTMDKFEAIIKDKDFEVFARIDHQKNAEGADLKMAPAQVIIFGNPKGGTMLMTDDIRVSLDLPLRVAVYQGTDDKVYIAYREPITMVKEYDLEGHKVIGKLSDGLKQLTSAAVAE